MTIAPVSAVPTEMPRLVIVFWSPPTSSLYSSETEETVTLPSCEARDPTPRPAISIGQVTISGPAPASSARHHDHETHEQREETDLDHPPRRGVRERTWGCRRPPAGA